jgi:transcriptional regulator with XRE-family HTH domain
MTGKKLLKRRQALGLTQQGLAERLAVSRNTVARWERGEMAIPGQMLDLALMTIEREKPRKKRTKAAT